MSAVAAQISVYNGVVTCQEGTGGITTITLATHETINQVRRHVLSRFDPGKNEHMSFGLGLCDCFGSV